MDIVVRQLLSADAEAYRTLRLAGLAESPEAFGSDLATESAATMDEFAATLASNYVVGAFTTGELTPSLACGCSTARR